jgi:type IV pilus assembly protein PilN
MIRINLLPQEEIPRTRTIKMPEVGAFAPVAVAAAAIVLCIGMSVIQGRSLDKLDNDVSELRSESQRLAPQIARIKQLQREREQLDKRLDVITSLDADRYFRVHLMSELSRRMPSNTWLSRIEEVAPGRYEVEGMTFSNFLVADFLHNLDESDYYHGLDLVSIVRGKIEDVNVLKFIIDADVGQPAVQMAAAPAGR